MEIEPHERIKNLGSILGVWAHPDDELFLAGGLLSIAVAQNQKAVCVTATKGEQGVQDEEKWPRDKLADIRSRELAAAYEILGLSDHQWLEYPDGGCHEVPEDEAVEKVASVIQRVRPDTILTFPPDGITGHFDHQAVSRWTLLAAKKTGFRGTILFCVDSTEAQDLFMRELDERFDVYFNVDKPVLVKRDVCDEHVQLPNDVLDKKIEALRAMPSQTSGMQPLFNDERFAEVLRHEQFVRSDRREIAWNKPYWQ
jgi:LmbE family N-acetylglucosaminyl deacetylase